jgi:Uma2 family endonuclease
MNMNYIQGNTVLKDAVQAVPRRFSYADYKDWELNSGERYELIQGEARAMAAPSWYHQSISVETTRQFANFFLGKPCKVFSAPFDVRLFYQEDGSDDTVVQPDLSVVCGKEKRGKEGCRGAPDFVLEILSPGNTAEEMQKKLLLYKEAGVREYWIVDPATKSVQKIGFETKAIGFFRETDTAAVDIFPGLEIDLSLVFQE